MKELMTKIVAICMLIASMLTMADTNVFSLPTQEEMNDMFGAPPSKIVKNWVRLDVLGVVNHPFPIVWVSPQEFKRIYPNYLVVFELTEFNKFKKFVRANKCSIKFDELTLTHPLRITEYVDGQEQELCIMPEKKVCGYLSNVLTIRGISWRIKNLDDFQKIVNEYDCPETQKIVEFKKEKEGGKSESKK